MLRERNKRYGFIKFVDISSEEYSPEDNQGLDYGTVIHLMLLYFLFLWIDTFLKIDSKKIRVKTNLCIS